MTSLVNQLQSLLLSLSLTAAPALAVTHAQQPLKEKENPRLIGQRDINKGQLNFYSREKEVAIGRQMAAEVDRYSKLVSDPIIAEYVNRLAQNLVINSDAKVPFTIKIVDADEVNAFALPGGFLYVNRGLIEAAGNEAELAGTLAHEIAHVTARHGVEQASKGQLLNWASVPLIFLGGIGGLIINQAAGIALPLTFLKFSRGAEKEADRLAAQYLWKAGYDPHALVSFFEKLQATEKKKPGTLEKVFRSHPMNSDRIKEVQKLLARFPEKSEYQISSSDFVAAQNRLGSISLNGRLRPAKVEPRRPTLKRRQPVQTEQEGRTKERPTLNRRAPATSP